MGKTFFSHEGFCSLVSVSDEEDLRPRPGQILSNPPPEDGRCECCGRHISELKPFGKVGDPLFGVFEGDYLIAFYRPERILSDERIDIIYESIDPEDPDALKYAKSERYVGAEPSWECRDCVALSHEEYFKKFGWEPF